MNQILGSALRKPDLGSNSTTVAPARFDLKPTHRAADARAGTLPCDPGLMTSDSVGDVEGHLLRRAISSRKPQPGLVPSRGTLGFSDDGNHPQSPRLGVGNKLRLTADGISRKCRAQTLTSLSPAELRRDTLARFGRDRDDALALALAVVAAP